MQLDSNIDNSPVGYHRHKYTDMNCQSCKYKTDKRQPLEGSKLSGGGILGSAVTDTS